jgi:hypothetical protein
MLAAVGTPEGGISQPARGRRLRIAKIAAIARERMSVTPDGMGSPFVEAAPKPRGAVGRFSEIDGRMSARARVNNA